ncbi:MAG: hypothetical protein Q8P41_22290 [Pseudomonadota bacterium]|nr:hypothetical protein [Pseudomonadota bacterium]
MLLALLACALDPAPYEAPPFDAPAAPEAGIQLHVPAVELAAGEERERCLYVATPHDADAWVSRIELVARPGLHHAMLVKAPEARTDEEDCFGIPEALMDDYTSVPEPVFASSTQVTEEAVAFPDGVALPLAAHQPMMIDYHLLNTGDEPMTGEVWINLHFREADDEPEAARLYVMANITGIDVPAQGEQTLTTTCSFPSDATVLSLTPHMHAHGRSFTASVVSPAGETPLLDTTRWENPETTWFDPTLAVSAGDAIRFTCAYTNDGDEPIGFGPTADDEMCMLFGYHWPADDLLWRADYDPSACTVE